MKIVEVLPIFAKCGVTRFVVDLCNELAKHHDVTIIVLYSLDVSNSYIEEIDNKISVCELNKKRGFDLRVFFRLSSLLGDINPDVIHIHTSSALQYVLPCILLNKKARCFYTLHSEATFETPNKLMRIINKYLLYKNNRCVPVANAKYVEDSFVAEYGIVPQMIPLGRAIDEPSKTKSSVPIEIQQIREGRGGVILLCVSNITRVKNQLMLCRVVNRLVKESHNIDLLLVGRSADDDYMREIVSEMCERVHIVGERKNVIDYMRNADLFCLTSTTESGPLVLIESFYAGLIPVCTPCGDVPNKINQGINGFYSGRISEESYYDVLKRALELSQEERTLLKYNVEQSYLLYSIETCADKYISLFSR